MKFSVQTLASAGVVFLLAEAFAFQQPTNPPLPNVDNRRGAPVPESAAPNDKAAAVAELRARLPRVRVDFHPVTQSPKLILNPEGFLSGPGGNGGAISGAGLATVPDNDPNRITKAFVREHSQLFGHGPEALEQARITREFVTAHNGMRTVVWEQQVDQVPVFEALLISHTTSKGELVNIASQFIANPQMAAERGATNRAALMARPIISSQQAVTTAAGDAGEAADQKLVTSLGTIAGGPEKAEKFNAPFLLGEAEAKLIWLPMDPQTLRLCWDVILTSRKRGEMFRILVDAETGVVQVRHGLTDYLSDATYRVFTSDSPSPFSPGYSTPVSTQPALVSRSVVTLSAIDTNASPSGWINDGGNETAGNNVDAHSDINGDNVPDLPRPQGSPARVFDFALDLTTQNPSAYRQAAVVQLFYWNNFMHDKLYELGFTEGAGNFQSNNFGRGGLGNDAVQADAQDGGGFNNANFSTPPDGSPGRMQMYIFNSPTPQRDPDLDAEIVLHEYTHGLSNRRVGGGVGISALQTAGMGEGWSDFYGLSMLSEGGDDVNGDYAAGAYVTYQLSGMTQNYYFGIRRYPYCTDMGKNPLTFKDIDPGQASSHTGIPRSSIVGTTADEVHNMGEVWCVSLWEVRGNLIGKHGSVLGNQRMLQLVTDGMNLSPANPNFLQARDAIIQADLVNNGGANRAQLWAGFAKRGMGLSATCPSSSSTSGLHEAYDLPDDLQISPFQLSSSGPVGGPFMPNPASFALLNAGTNAMNWSVASSGAWFTIFPTNGILGSGSTSTVSVLISAAATNFPLGSTSSIIWFTNQSSGIEQPRTFSLSIVGRTLFENFEPDIHESLWSGFGGSPGSTVIATNYGGSVSGVNSLWFGDAGTRSATTIPVNTSGGGTISFYLRLGNGSYPWEEVDIPGEGIVLEYSTNNGATWTLMGTYNTSTFYSWTQVTTNIPTGALSAATQFRWRQLSHSGACCDHWALDDISIDAGPTPPSILTQPISQTLKSGSNVTFTVAVQGSFPLIYQWRKDGTNLIDGGRIWGATNATLSISTLLESDSGQYSVVVTNLYGSATSSNAALLVTPLDHFEWGAISSPQAAGIPFSVTISAKDFQNATVTNFNGAVSLSASASGGQTTNTILGNLVYDSSSSGLYTLGFAFTPSTSIVVTHVRSYSGTKVSIWQTNGTLLASQNVTSVPGTWVETALAAPVSLTGGSTYVVGFYTAGATYYMRTDRTNTFPNGKIQNAYYYASADAYPSNVFVSQTVFLVDLRYTVNPGAPVVLSPTSSGLFTNGLWSGTVTVQAPASNVVLRADEGGGHSGLSNPFDVLLQNDLSITSADFPDPVAVGANLTYTLNVANVGPSPAASVLVTNFLPPGVSFISANSSQGSCTQSAGIVSCNLGTVPGGTNATVSIVVVPNAAGILTNTATVTRSEADPYLGNNTAIVATVAQVPAISISDCTVLEGNFGTTIATFTVSLSVAGALPVSVNYATADGTAQGGTDYVTTNGTITFVPGQTNTTIIVVIKGDTTGEPDETFAVNLSGATNAALADAQGVGTILNDDAPPAAYVRSTTGAPWNSTSNEAAMNRVFGSNNWQDLRYETVNPGLLFSAAKAFIYLEGSDADATEMETFLASNMDVIQDWVNNGGSLFLNAAPNEDNGMNFGFGVTLVYLDQTSTAGAAVPAHPIFNGPFTPVGTSWTGNYFGHATVTGTGLTTLITNAANSHLVLGEKAWGAGHVLFGGMTTDNFQSPQPQASNLRANIIAYLSAISAYHFEWSTISSPQQLNVPFPVTMTARDATNGILTTFNGVVNLRAMDVNSNVVPITPASSGNFTNGVWSGSITVQQPAPSVLLSGDDANGHSGSSNPFEVIAPNDISLRLDQSPNPVSAGANLTYTLSITNTGPADATGVLVTNVLPAGVTFISATASQGAWTQSAGTVFCDLGTINGGTNATITILVVPAVAGTSLTNLASVSRAEADGYQGNNSAGAITVVTTPAISISDGSVSEGDAGTTNMVFAVTLAAPSAQQTITVNYATRDGTAAAGSDYVATNGSLAFPPGTTNLSLMVTVMGDKIIETNETFVVNLSSPVNGVLGRGQGVGTIINDDGLPGFLHHFAWSVISSPQAVGVPFGATITAEDFFNNLATNFTGQVALSAPSGGGVATNTILGAPGHTTLGSGNWTLGYSFTPNRNLTLTHVRHYYGTKVSIWTDGGVLLYAQNVTSSPGTWTQTPIPPIELTAGTTYRVAAYTGGGTYYWRSDLAGTFPDGTIDQSYYSSGDAFPDISDDARWWFVDLRYTVKPSVLITPPVSGNFTNGIWSGNVTVQELATNVLLQADDGVGHAGFSNPFNLVLQNDLYLTMSELPNPVSVGENLTYTLNISNTGPTVATSVLVTNVLPANVTFGSASVSQGTYTQGGGLVICDLGTVPGATNATVTIVVVPTLSGGVLTNTATISRGEPDAYLGNNIATAVTAVTPPAISISDAAIVEANVGTTNMVFAVSLNVPSSETITVNFATANGSAIAGGDYLATNGILTFNSGVTNRSMVVNIIGDTLIESDETLFVNLFSPSNGVLARSQGIGTIINDDGMPGKVDHFSWAPIASPQITNSPLTAAITALDAYNTTVTNFNGPVNLSASSSGGVGGQTVQILSFILYADTSITGEYRQTLTAISNYFPAFVETSTSTTDAATLQAQLAGKQVFLIVEQESATTGLLGALGTAWSTVLNNFVNNGGIVIACGWNTEEYLILSNSGLMNLTRFGAPSTDSISLGGAHFLNEGVSAPFLGSYVGWYSSTNGTTVLQSSASGYGVVMARDVGLGHVVMIGTDYFTLGTPMDRVVANAVRWAQGAASASVPVSPMVSGIFSNGIWTGGVAVQAFATNVVLRADDGDGHIGLSNPFHVITSNQPPVILASLANAVAYLSGTASFQANVLGSIPLFYQWRFNGADIPEATNSKLNLNHVTLAQAGNYSVVVWNPFGTNSTGKATLSVAQVVAWGAGTNNSGLNFNYGQSTVPSGLTNAIRLYGGLYHSLAVKSDGTITAWGAGATNFQISPHYGQSVVPPLGSTVAAAGGGYHSLGLRADGTLAAWGAGTNNLLAAPRYGQCILPSNSTNIVAIAAGDYHSVALRSDGRVLVWGYNGFGQTNVPIAATSNVAGIASRASHVLALKSDGSLVHWGSFTTLPTGISNIVTIAAGATHCLALKSDGTVVAWGSQTVVPSGLSNVVDIAAGVDHNVALRSDGTVVTWGATNLYGRSQIPVGLSNFVGIACGNYNSLGLLGDGSPVIKWQPVSRSILLNSPASFYVLAAGSQLSYQWQLNGTNIPGSTNFTCTIQSAQALDAGSYRVVLANAFGAVTSAVATLTVLAPIGVALDAPNLTWSTSGNAAWFGETMISHDGADAAQSGHIIDNQQSTVQASVSGPGMLNFWWKVSSEQFFDYLNFFIDGTQQASISGESDWRFESFDVSAGAHTLKWTYQKDSSVSSGLDAGWLDQILYTTNPPVITVQPVSQTNSMGATFNLTVSASGAPPVTYQWLKAGTNINGALSSVLNIVNASRIDSGTYSAVASNPGGSTVSSNGVVWIRVPQVLQAMLQPDGSIALTSGDADGGFLSPEDVGRFESQISSNLLDWISFTNPIVLTNGTLLLIDQDSTNYPMRFYRIIEH